MWKGEKKQKIYFRESTELAVKGTLYLNTHLSTKVDDKSKAEILKMHWQDSVSHSRKEQ